MLIESAEHIHPEIALGIYFQIFGGLRRGEVVNILISDITLRGPYGVNGCIINIGYKPFLWTRLSDPSKCQVKRNVLIFPIQPIEVIPYLFKRIYLKHKLYLEKNQKINKQNAMFIDNTGNPLNGSDYEKRFNNIKKYFLKRVEVEMPEYHHLLSSTSWGTHIGRGIYTNLMAKVVKSASELAIRRADKNLETALTYISKDSIRNDIESGLSKLFEDNIEKEVPFDDIDRYYSNSYGSAIGIELGVS